MKKRFFFYFLLSILFSIIIFPKESFASTNYTFPYYIIKEDGNIYGKMTEASNYEFLITQSPIELIEYQNKILTKGENTDELFLEEVLLGSYPTITKEQIIDTVAPTDKEHFKLVNGSIRIYYPNISYYTRLSNYISPFMKEGKHYIRKYENGLFNFYEFYGDLEIYAFTYDDPYTLFNVNQLSTLSGTDIDNIILRNSYTSPLYSWGYAFKRAEEAYNLNALYILAHAIHETGWGRSEIALDKNNLFGLKAYDSCPYTCAASFVSFEDSILYNAWYVKRRYTTPGGTYYHGPHIKGMNVRYATDKLWADKIAGMMHRFIPWNHFGSFYSTGTNNDFYVKKMTGDTKIGTSPDILEKNILVKRFNNMFLDTKNDDLLGVISSPYLTMTDGANIYSYSYTIGNDITFKSILPDLGANVFKNPDETSEVLKTLEKGTIFHIRNTQNGFYQVMLQDKTFGWIKSSETK